MLFFLIVSPCPLGQLIGEEDNPKYLPNLLHLTLAPLYAILISEGQNHHELKALYMTGIGFAREASHNIDPDHSKASIAWLYQTENGRPK